MEERNRDVGIVGDEKTFSDYYHEGLTLNSEGKSVEAMACYENALASCERYKEKIQSAQCDTWCTIGLTLMTQGQYAEAITHYDKALDLDEAYQAAWMGKGDALRNQGHYAGAIVCYDKALDNDQNPEKAINLIAQVHKALAHLMLGDIRQVEESLKHISLEENTIWTTVLAWLYSFARKDIERFTDLFSNLEDHFLEESFRNNQIKEEQLEIYFCAVKFFLQYDALSEALFYFTKGFVLQKKVLSCRWQKLHEDIKKASLDSGEKEKCTENISSGEISAQWLNKSPELAKLEQIPWQDIQREDLSRNPHQKEALLGRWKGVDVTVKQVPFSISLEKFQQEAKIIAQCDSPHIVQLYGICLDINPIAMVMEYLPKGSLQQVLQDKNEKLLWNEPIRWNIAEDVGKGLSYLHDQKIVHRDLNSAVILLDNHYQAKISGFESAKIKLTDNNTVTQTRGESRWLAPEILFEGKNPTFASDIYSYGMILWEIASRRLPYPETKSVFEVVNLIQKGNEKIPTDCPAGYRKVIENCWKKPHERPSAQYALEALRHARPEKVSSMEELQEKEWHLDLQIRSKRIETGYPYELIEATEKDKKKAIEFYQHHPVPGYDICSIKVIYNPDMNQKFSLYLSELQQRHNNPAFEPKWQDEKRETAAQLEQRKKVATLLETLEKPYKDGVYPSITLLPVWHGTKPEIVGSIFSAGYANLATLDPGFFGKGIYSTYEAAYAHAVYSKGALILNWVALFSAYPIIDADMGKKFLIRDSDNKPIPVSSYANYDAHFAPVVPISASPKERTYMPPKAHQPHKYTELVVFQSAACLPRYLVEIKPSRPAHPLPQPSLQRLSRKVGGVLPSTKAESRQVSEKNPLEITPMEDFANHLKKVFQIEKSEFTLSWRNEGELKIKFAPLVEKEGLQNLRNLAKILSSNINLEGIKFTPNWKEHTLLITGKPVMVDQVARWLKIAGQSYWKQGALVTGIFFKTKLSILGKSQPIPTARCAVQ